MSHHRRLGLSGEEWASDYLRGKGYEILERNFRTPLGEIDIIAKERNTIVFVEVKTRASETYGRAEEAVGFTKQHQIIRVAQIYLKANGKENADCRFDVVAIHEKGSKVEAELIKNAFYLGSW